MEPKVVGGAGKVSQQPDSAVHASVDSSSSSCTVLQGHQGGGPAASSQPSKTEALLQDGGGSSTGCLVGWPIIEVPRRDRRHLVCSWVALLLILRARRFWNQTWGKEGRQVRGGRDHLLAAVRLPVKCHCPLLCPPLVTPLHRALPPSSYSTTQYFAPPSQATAQCSLLAMPHSNYTTALPL